MSEETEREKLRKEVEKYHKDLTPEQLKMLGVDRKPSFPEGVVQDHDPMAVIQQMNNPQNMQDLAFSRAGVSPETRDRNYISPVAGTSDHPLWSQGGPGDQVLTHVDPNIARKIEQDSGGGTTSYDTRGQLDKGWDRPDLADMYGSLPQPTLEAVGPRGMFPSKRGMLPEQTISAAPPVHHTTVIIPVNDKSPEKKKETLKEVAKAAVGNKDKNPFLSDYTPPPGVGDEGSSQAQAATNPPPTPDQGTGKLTVPQTTIKGSRDQGTGILTVPQTTIKGSRDQGTGILTVPQTTISDYTPPPGVGDEGSSQAQAATNPPPTPDQGTGILTVPQTTIKGSPYQGTGKLTVPQTTIKGSPQQVPGATLAKSDSPERQLLGAEDKSRARDIAALDAQAQSVKKQQDMLISGTNQAADMTKAAGIDDFLKGSELQNLQGQAQNHAMSRQRDLDQEAAELRQAKVDPKQWFKDNGTAGNILAAIAIAGGAFAAAMPHTNNNQNQALSIINAAVERNVDAQNKSISDRWRGLEFKANENEKTYVKDQYFLNQKREAKIVSYDHAMAMVRSQLQSSNDKVAVEGMQGLLTQLTAQKEKLVQEGAEQRAAVMIRERAQAAAQSGSSQITAKQIMERAIKMYDDPNWQQPAGMDRAAASVSEAQRFYGGKSGIGATVTKAGSGTNKEQEAKEQEESFEKGLTGIGKRGAEASKAGTGDWLLGNLPAVFAPGSNLAMQHLDQYNDGVIPAATRLLGDRVPPEFIKEQTERFKLKTTDPDNIKRDKVAGFMDFLRTNRQINVGAKKGATDEEGSGGGVLGAEELGK